MDDYLRIRLLHRDGTSARQIAKRLGHSRETVKKALLEAVPRPYTRSKPVVCPKLGRFIPVIEQILEADVLAPRKQRHTAARIFDRLREEHHYAGGYDQVRRWVAAHRKRQRETHLLLDHPPGGRLECDFGLIHVDFPEGRRKVPVLLAVWSYSQYPFAIALPDETTGSILYGLVCALEFFRCVPAEVWWDNPTTVAKAILRGRDRQLNPYYAALASHYRFAPLFCLVAKGQEKSDVERTVYALERRFATPVPQVQDLDALNRHLLACCVQEGQRTVSGRSQSIGQMFQEEQRQASELPEHPFDPCIQQIRQADKYQTVLFENVRYSVPRHVAFEPVTVKAYLDRVVLVHKGQVVAAHQRSRTPGDQVLEPTHFLAVLTRKPAYLDHTRLFKELKLPTAFAELRDRLTQELGQRTGTRHYIRILQLLGRYSAVEVARAIESCLQRQMLRAEFIEQKLATAPHALDATLSVALTAPSAAGSLAGAAASAIPQMHVPAPDLRRFDALLSCYSNSQGEDHARNGDAAQTQPQDVEAADDAGRVCQAGA